MTKKIFNWIFRDVDSFLKEHKFVLNYTNGSHHYYIGHKNHVLRHVCVPFHGSKVIKPRTLRGIILQSGIPQKDWLGK